MQRYGSVLKLRPGMLQEYKKYHAKIWPSVAEMIRRGNIKNYSIFHRDGYLFSYFEYHGTDYDADMGKMASDPETIKWWGVMKPMQQPVETCAEGEWWADMEEVFHQD